MADQATGWATSSPFPQSSLRADAVLAALQGRCDEIPDPTATARLGYAMGPPHPVALEAWARFAARNPNNVGLHSRFGEGKLGARALEKDVVAAVSGLLHADAADGYVTQGGTEANLAGLRLGRNALRDGGRRRVAVVTSSLAHNSIFKAAEILDLELVKLPVEASYVLSPDKVLEAVRLLHLQGVSRVIVVSTAGYFSTGLVDPIQEIAAALEQCEATNPEIQFYHHVDAAYGAFFFPFSTPGLKFDFRVRSVHSMSADAHKFALAPYGCGLFLCRKGLIEFGAIEARASGIVDETIAGSRPGAAAAAIWALIHHLGREGFEELAKVCVAQADNCIERLLALDPGFRIVRRADSNVFAFALPDRCAGLPQDVQAAFRFVPYAMPIFDGEASCGSRPFYHCYIMPHIDDTAVDRFLAAMAESLDIGPASGSASANDFIPPSVKQLAQGTPCLRHSVAHPKGRRDPSGYPQNYSFHTFQSRRLLEEPLRERSLYTSATYGEIALYAPDLERPFENELGGVASLNQFHFEVLDRHQSALSLVGQAHLSLHTERRTGQLLANFHASGILRSVEMRLGRGAYTDELQIFSDSIVLKIGKDARAFHREFDDYAFSVDTSLEIRVTVGADLPPEGPSDAYYADPKFPRRRHLSPTQLKRFPNRFFGAIGEVAVLATGEPRRWGPFRGTSASWGSIDVWLESESGIVSFDIQGLDRQPMRRLIIPTDLGGLLERSLPRLDTSSPEDLCPVVVARHAEALADALTPFAALLDDGQVLDLGRIRQQPIRG